MLAYGVRAPSASLLAPSVFPGLPTRPAIALTFDDGPSESTPVLFKILARWAASATFFQCGVNVRRLPEIARAVAAAGHEIGNHTDTHPMYFASRDSYNRELAAAQETIEQIAGRRPRYFRAPYGVRWFGLREAQRRLDLTGVMWTTLAMDWKRPAAQVARGSCGAPKMAQFSACTMAGRFASGPISGSLSKRCARFCQN